MSGSKFQNEPAPLVERGCAPVYFIGGVGRIDNLGGGNVMLTFYRPDSGRREIEVKIVCHRDDADRVIRQVDGHLHQGLTVNNEDQPFMM